jgi:hypothetical protein
VAEILQKHVPRQSPTDTMLFQCFPFVLTGASRGAAMRMRVSGFSERGQAIQARSMTETVWGEARPATRGRVVRGESIPARWSGSRGTRPMCWFPCKNARRGKGVFDPSRMCGTVGPARRLGTDHLRGIARRSFLPFVF